MYSSGSWRNSSTDSPAEKYVKAPPGRLVLLGHPVAHSLSPIFQNAALRAARIPRVYEAIDVAPKELRFLFLG